MNKEKVTIVFDSSYHSTLEWMSKEKQGDHIYPCIMNVGKGDKITKLFWSNTNTRGHFGIPKVVWGKFGANVFVDDKGEYGLCEHGTAIVDEEENLPLIKQAMKSKEFIDLMRYCDVGGLGTAYNNRVIAMFRKDFWKEFNEGEQQ